MGRKLRLLTAVFLALPLAAISQIHPTYAASQNVQDCTFATLQNDLQSSGDWYYTPGQCTSPITFTGVINIDGNSSLTAQGNDITLDGGGTTQLFNVAGAGSLTIGGLTLENGANPIGGGAIWSDGTLNVTDSTFAQNKSPYGGAVNVDSGTATISASTFASNSATGSNSASAGAVYINGGIVNITNSTFTGNAADEPTGALVAGGVIFNDGTTTIVDSTLDGNLASGSSASGGAIFNYTGTVTVAGSIVAENQVVSGSATDVSSCSGTITDGGNNLESITDCGFNSPSDLQNTAPKLGSLASNGGPTQTMALLGGSPAIGAGNCTLKDWTNNTITADQRGEPRPYTDNAPCDIGAYELQPDPCPATEGALAADMTLFGSGGTLTFDCASPTTIHFDTGQEGGGDPIAVTSSQNITLDASHSPAPVTLDGGNATQLFTVASGGSLTLNSLTLSNANSPSDIGGAIDSVGTLTVENSSFTNDTTAAVGFSGTDSGSSGGAIYSQGTLSVTNSTFSGDTSTGSGGSGGAIATTGLTTIIDSTFTNNSANGDGGAVNGNNATGVGPSIFTGNTFTGNSAATFGGAASFGSQNPASFTNNTFEGNTAGSDGAAIYTFVSADLSFDTIAGNTGSAAIGTNPGSGPVAITATILDNTINCDGQGVITDDNSNLTYNGNHQATADAAGVCGLGNAINGDPLLGSLANNGGPTQTMALLAGSPAIHITASCDDTSKTTAVTTDQRGLPRPSGKGCSIGAYEPQPGPIVPTLTTPADHGYINPKAPDGVLSWSGVTDPTGVTYSVQYMVAGGTVGNPTCDFSTSPTEVDGITGTSYTFPAGVSDGIYCWRVQAVNGASVASGYSAPRVVTLDSEGPATAIAFPRDGTDLDVSGWANGCNNNGIPVTYSICGTAEDLGSGVAGVLVSIKDKSNGQYWNGATCTWQSAPFFNYAISGGGQSASGGVTNTANSSGLRTPDGGGGSSLIGGGSSLIGGGSSLIGGGSSLIGGGSSLIGLPTDQSLGYSAPASGTQGTICSIAGSETGGATQLSSSSGGGSSLIGGGSSLIGGGSSLIGGGSSLIGGGSSLIGGGSSLIGGGSSLIGGNQTAVSWYYPVDMPTNGDYLIQAAAVDGAGNLSPGDQADTSTAEHPTVDMLIDGATQSGAINVAPDATIKPTFSVPMYFASEGNITLTGPNGNVPLTIDCSSDSSSNCESPHITPANGPLLPLKTYTLTIPATGPSNGPCIQNNVEYCVVDQGLNALTTTDTFTFTTSQDDLPPDLSDPDGDAIPGGVISGTSTPNGWDGGTVTLAGGTSFNTGSWGFSPQHKDLCVVEYYMNGPAADGNSYNQVISQAANQDIVNAFANAPGVTNPDGKAGVHLVIFEANNNLATSGSLTSSSAGNSAGLPTGYSGPYYGGQVPMTDPFGQTISGGNFDWTAFDKIANQYFVPTGLAQVCHMALIVHTLNGSLATGTSRGIGASDFIVALGTVPGGVGTEVQQAGTVMHELGHNLGLRHGGDADVNFKPNYMSIMNYDYQLRGVPGGRTPLGIDYSSGGLNSLDKQHLVDAAGMTGTGASTFGARYWCLQSNGTYVSEVVANAAGPINWGCLASGPQPSTTPATTHAEPINQEAAGSNQILTDYNDWANLTFDGGTIGFGAVIVPQQSNVDVDPNEPGGVNSAQNVLGPSVSYGSLLALNPSAAGAVSISGNGCVSTTLQVDVASNNSGAISTSGTCASGKALSSATGIASNGGATSGCCSPAVGPLAFQLVDPLAGSVPLPVYKSGAWTYTTTSVTNNQTTETANTLRAGSYNSSTQTYSPGVYTGGISVSGSTKATLSPGVYVLDGGGLSVTGNATLSGKGVFIYNTASSGSCGAIKLSGGVTVTLSPAASGPFAGATLDQAAGCSSTSDDTTTIAGNPVLNVSGTMDMPAGNLKVSGGAQIVGTGAQLVVDELTVSGNGVVKLN